MPGHRRIQKRCMEPFSPCEFLKPPSRVSLISLSYFQIHDGFIDRKPGLSSNINLSHIKYESKMQATINARIKCAMRK